MAEGTQSIRGKDLGNRINGDEATKVLAASKTRAYQFKTYTAPGPGFTNQDMSTVTPDAPNAADNLFSKFKRAQRIFVRASVDITIKLGDNDDLIPIRIADGGLFEETHVEFEKLLVTAAAGAVIDVFIS